MSPWMWCLPFMEHSVEMTMPTGSTPPGMPGTHPPNILVGGDVNGNIPPILGYYVLSDIADHYWLPPVRSASSRFHSVIRRHQFASVRQADSRLTRLVPPNLELALTPLPSPSFFYSRQPSFSANPSHRSYPFPGIPWTVYRYLWASTFYFFSFSLFPLFSCWFRAVDSAFERTLK